ncbi:uncharacterized protein RCC_08743 [Ramularia collo-cygni]|uniref:F-box domain-containing protein n=1 Tax=Ramularia collo-cygni TaxID=112498 RepID=A0A2D3V4W8_9PEZI|nr:uncharacterized protein RCC_08743 [Ramularia collo-cygni]CZT23033.1 uncharacterized protein RCC_08743 [Ramularia collo-cygni]
MATISRSESATEAVFGTPELLEMILVLLPPDSIITCRRVSKTTYSTIMNPSKALKRALFFLPVRSTLNTDFFGMNTFTHTMRMFPYKINGASFGRRRGQRPLPPAIPITYNQLLFKRGESTSMMLRLKHSPLHHAHAPNRYKNMYITQPPVTTVEIWATLSLQPLKDWGMPVKQVHAIKELRKENGVGVTWGMIDEMFQAQAKAAETQFGKAFQIVVDFELSGLRIYGVEF